MTSPSVHVLGVRVDCVDMDEALDTIAGMIAARRGGLVATVNPEIVMRARRDTEYRAVLDSAALALADGVGVAWAARRVTGARCPRVTGVDLVEALAARAVADGWRVFLLGGRPGIAAGAARTLRESTGAFAPAGTHAGSPGEDDEPEIHALIDEAHADVVLVAFGFPVQETWISRLVASRPHIVGIGVGGAFDYLAGTVPRAPAWMRRLGLEWLFRLVRQPWRIRRMAVLPLFAIAALRERREI